VAVSTEMGGLERALSLGAPPGGPRRTAYEYVRDFLRQAILKGTLEGGQRLVQTEIAQLLKVSTTPVREALRDLATEGLVHLDAHRGGIVNRLTFEDLVEINDLCRLVEPEAMGQVAAIATEALIAEARRIADQMSVEQDPAQWAELNREFHGIILDAIPSARFRSLLHSLHGSVAPYVAMAIRSQGSAHFHVANREHLEILDALQAGDAERCANLTRDHVALTLAVLADERDRFASLTSDADASA
jgi:DNA-binding GntR family transcriptional regulator